MSDAKRVWPIADWQLLGKLHQQLPGVPHLDPLHLTSEETKAGWLPIEFLWIFVEARAALAFLLNHKSASKSERPAKC